MFRPSNLPTVLCGIIGPAILVASFVINPAPLVRPRATPATPR